MTSDVIDHTAKWSPNAAADGNGAWVVTWVPQRLFDRNSAMTAMHLAEAIANGDSPESALVRTFADELGVSAEYAVDAVKRGVA